MYKINISLQLPKPWKNKIFQTHQIGYLNFLVGSNGSGKSRFCEALKDKLPKCRLLSSDRLSGLFFKAGSNSHLIMRNDLVSGFNKSYFEQYKESSKNMGIGADAFVILEEKLDVRIKVEATLSQIFNREMRLEWDSGRLVPKAFNITQEDAYQLHKDECHGIKELIILLTHLYDDENKSLIIDEPELNLHPQFQAFFVQEVRKIAGDPSLGKKIIFFVTHSPFILDINSSKDLRSVICFHSDFKEPSTLFNKTDEEIASFSSIISRLNVHHKQLFFADCPVFVEGIFDAQFIKAIQEFRGTSMEGSGSCIIDVGGNAEIALYHKLIEAFNKKALYIYDLDSVFTKALRSNAETDDKILTFLAKIGAGTEFQRYCGELEQFLTGIINEILEKESINQLILHLKDYLKKVMNTDDKDKHKKARVALLIHLDKHRESLCTFLSELQIISIEGKFSNILEALKKQGVYLLRGGALEHYLPSYVGNIYEIDDSIKKKTIEKEIEYINISLKHEELNDRYKYLYEIISLLPASKKIDYKTPIKKHLSSLVYKIQNGIQSGLLKNVESIPKYLGSEWDMYKRILRIESLNVENNEKFECILTIFNKWDIGEMKLTINEKANSGMGFFELTSP